MRGAAAAQQHSTEWYRLSIDNEMRWSEARDQGVVEICVGLVDDEDEKIKRSASTLIQVLQRVVGVRK
ncbi:hypothetical protein Droror1_Dr00017229 [Drosera rotundifolia]